MTSLITLFSRHQSSLASLYFKARPLKDHKMAKFKNSWKYYQLSLLNSRLSQLNNIAFNGIYIVARSKKNHLTFIFAITPCPKYDRNLRGGCQMAISVCESDAMLCGKIESFSISHSEGWRGCQKKGKKLRSFRLLCLGPWAYAAKSLWSIWMIK